VLCTGSGKAFANLHAVGCKVEGSFHKIILQPQHPQPQPTQRQSNDPLTPLTPCAPLLTPWTPRSTPSTSRGSSLNSAAFPSVGKLHYPGKDFIPNSYRLHTGLSHLAGAALPCPPLPLHTCACLAFVPLASVQLRCAALLAGPTRARQLSPLLPVSFATSRWAYACSTAQIPLLPVSFRRCSALRPSCTPGLPCFFISRRRPPI